MLSKRNFIIFELFVTVYSATLYSKPIDIPVEIIYSDAPYETNISPLHGVTGRRNLNEKIKLSATEFKQLSTIEKDYDINGIKNLEAKVQLSPKNLLENYKHIPDQDEVNSNVQLKLLNKADSNLSQEISKPEAAVTLMESSIKKDNLTEVPLSESVNEKVPDPNVILLIQVAEKITSNGLANIRENIEQISASNENSDQKPLITTDKWNKLNESLSNFFANLIQRYSVKTNKATILQDIEVGVKGLTNNFIESLRSPNDTQPGTTPKPPSVGQNIMVLIAKGFQRLADTIRNRTSTAQYSAGGSTNVSQRPIQNFFNQLFGQSSSTQPQPQAVSVTTLNPIPQIETAANGVPQGVNTLTPVIPNSPNKFVARADGTTTQPNPFQGIQEFASNVGQAINNLNPFNPSSSSAPDAQGDSPTTTNPIQQAFNQVGQAINNLNPFNQQSSAANGSQGDTGNNPNPIQSFQQAVGQVINNINPFNQGSTSAPGSQNEGTTSAGGPIQQALSNIVSQVGSAINNINPGTQNEGETTPNQPLQNVFSQVGQAISNLNPFNQGSTSTSSPINQIVQAVSTLNPVSPPSSSLETIQVIGSQGQQIISQLSSVSPIEAIQGAVTVPTSLPTIGNPSDAIQGISNQGQQIINQLSSANPAEAIQGIVTISTPSSPISNPSQIIQEISNQGQQIISQLPSTNPAESIQGVVTIPTALPPLPANLFRTIENVDNQEQQLEQQSVVNQDKVLIHKSSESMKVSHEIFSKQKQQTDNVGEAEQEVLLVTD